MVNDGTGIFDGIPSGSSGNQTWLAGKSLRSRGFNRKSLYKWGSHAIALFDPVWLYIYIYIAQIYIYIYLFIYLFIFILIFIEFYRSLSLSPSLSLSCLSIYLSIYLSISLSLSLRVSVLFLGGLQPSCEQTVNRLGAPEGPHTRPRMDEFHLYGSVWYQGSHGWVRLEGWWVIITDYIW